MGNNESEKSGNSAAKKNRPKTIKERVEKAFFGADIEEISEYAEMTRINLFSLKRNIKQTMFMIFGIVLLFELSLLPNIENGNGKSELNLLFFKVDDITLLTKLAPLAVSYFYYELIMLFSSRKILLKSHSVLLEKCNPKIHQESLEEIYAPISTFSMTLFFSPKWKKFVYNNGGVIGMTFTLAPIGFIIYSYIRSFKMFGYETLLLIFLPFTLFFCITAITVVGKTSRIV